MEEDGEGRPRSSQTARTLGVRPGIDIPFDDDYEVEPFTRGMSVTPDSPNGLPFFRPPPGHGGSGKDPVWEIDSDELGEGLIYRPDDAAPGPALQPPRTLVLSPVVFVAALSRASVSRRRARG
jgi:hypothetical protein